MAEVKIVCPNCKWEPDGKPYWECHCGHVWNAFDTAGRCPECSFQHNYTQCVQYAGGCTAYTPHIDWYVGLEEMVGELVYQGKIRS